MSLRHYIDIARPSTWTKNVFVLPGILLAYFFQPPGWSASKAGMVLGMLATCLVASSNYVLNEILDARSDRHHPDKRSRPVAAGLVSLPLAWTEWIVLGVIGVVLGFLANVPTGLVALALWIMGLVYNVPPLRCKDRVYLDVLVESVNNPIRLAMGWYSTGVTYPPTLSVIMAYWMFGAFLMAIKRFAEFRHIDDPERAASYRASFRWYTEERLLISVIYYATAFGMFSGVFIARYCIELVLATPIVAFAVAYYVHLGHKPDSAVQYPETLFEQKKLLAIVVVAFLVCAVLLFVKLPRFDALFNPLVMPQR
jgi:4-hydroxybenzoate polyprenyltransferase